MEFYSPSLGTQTSRLSLPASCRKVSSLFLSGYCAHPNRFSKFVVKKSLIPQSLLILLFGCLKLSSQEMPEIVVRADKPTTSLIDQNQETSRQELSKLSGAFSIQELEKVQQKANTTLADSLFDVPGLYARSRNQSSQTRISIRGSGAARNADIRGIALQLNGLPLNAADADFDYLTAIEPLSLSHIKVMRSANSSGAVSNNLGGSLDFVSHTGATADSALVRAEFGSFGYWRQHAASGWSAGDFDGFVSVNNLMQDGFRDHSQLNRQHIDLNLGWKEGGTWENRLYFTRVHSNEELPGALSLAEISANSAQAVGGASLFNRARADWRDEIIYNRIADRFAWQDTDQSLIGGLWFSFADVKNPRNQVFDKQYHDTGTRLTYTHESLPGGSENTFSVTLTSSHAWSDETVYRNEGGGLRGATVDDVTLKWFNTDLYFQNRLQISEKLFWIASLQLAYAQRSIHDRVAIAGQSRTQDEVDYYAFSPSTGLVYQFDEQNQLYLNLSRSHEPPTQGDLYRTGNAHYDHQEAQTATTVEIGTRGQQGAFRWDSAYYHSWLENEFLITEVAPGINETRNTPESIHQGFEASLRWELLPQDQQLRPTPDSLLLSQTYTWSDFQLQDDPLFNDNPIPGIPEHLLQTSLNYQHNTGFFSSISLQLQPVGIYADYAHTLQSDSFASMDWKIGYGKASGFQAFFEIRNLSDEKYITEVSVVSRPSGNQRYFFPASGRAFYGGISWKW